MKYLILMALIVVGFAQQPAKTLDGKAPAETDRGQIARQGKRGA